MNTLETLRRIILRVFHGRVIKMGVGAARDRGDVVVYADGSIISRKLLPKGVESNGRDDDKDTWLPGRLIGSDI
jgi:hypothetical protein